MSIEGKCAIYALVKALESDAMKQQMEAAGVGAFEFEHGGTRIGLVRLRGAIWFLGSDIVGALSLKPDYAAGVVEKLNPAERELVRLTPPGKCAREFLVISEVGLWALVGADYETQKAHVPAPSGVS